MFRAESRDRRIVRVVIRAGVIDPLGPRSTLLHVPIIPHSRLLLASFASSRGTGVASRAAGLGSPRRARARG